MPRRSRTPFATRRRRRCATRGPRYPEDVEQLVFRALHKDPGVRFASGRELARALRQVQGHTVPLELQTAVVDASRPQAAMARLGRTRRARALAVALLGLAAAGGLAAWYVSRPPVRTFVAVAPVVNGTGDRTLDPYRLGAHAGAHARARASRDGVRVLAIPAAAAAAAAVPARRVVTCRARRRCRRFAPASGAPVLVVPTLLYDRGAWKASAELQDASGTVTGRLETAPIESSLTKDAAATLIATLAGQIDARLRGAPLAEARGPNRRRAVPVARRGAGVRSRGSTPTTRPNTPTRATAFAARRQRSRSPSSAAGRVAEPRGADRRRPQRRGRGGRSRAEPRLRDHPADQRSSWRRSWPRPAVRMPKRSRGTSLWRPPTVTTRPGSSSSRGSRIAAAARRTPSRPYRRVLELSPRLPAAGARTVPAVQRATAERRRDGALVWEPCARSLQGARRPQRGSARDAVSGSDILRFGEPAGAGGGQQAGVATPWRCSSR